METFVLSTVTLIALGSMNAHAEEKYCGFAKPTGETVQQTTATTHERYSSPTENRKTALAVKRLSLIDPLRTRLE
jgi:hypothetical protein